MMTQNRYSDSGWGLEKPVAKGGEQGNEKRKRRKTQGAA